MTRATISLHLGTILVLLGVGWQSAAVPSSAQEPTGDFRPLFNGRNLDGWTSVSTAPSTWTVREGMLICSGKPYGELRTTRMYQNFILELEWRHMHPRGNAGIFVWADDITSRGVPFHRSIEVQVLENAYGDNESHTTHGDIFPIHGATMKPINGRGGSRAFPTKLLSRPSPQWNHYRIECRDGNISLAVNGELVTRGEECTPRKGYLCIESEGGVVHYRNVRLLELPSSPLSPDQIAVADRGYRCLYRGIDLDGWEVEGSGWEPNDWILSFTGTSAGTLTTAELFGDVGFVIDFRSQGNDSKLVVGVRGAEIKIDPADKRWSDHLAPNREWNRLAGELHGNRMTLKLNKDVVLSEREVNANASGPLRIHAESPVDLANLFVRVIP